MLICCWTSLNVIWADNTYSWIHGVISITHIQLRLSRGLHVKYIISLFSLFNIRNLLLYLWKQYFIKLWYNLLCKWLLSLLIFISFLVSWSLHMLRNFSIILLRLVLFCEECTVCLANHSWIGSAGWLSCNYFNWRWLIHSRFSIICGSSHLIIFRIRT